MVVRSITESEKMRRVPGIVYVDGPAGRRAHIKGSGTDVVDVIRTYRKANGDETRLSLAFHWLTPQQLQTALRFYSLFPAEIDEWLADEATITLDRVHAAVSARYGSSDRKKSK